MKHVDIDPIVDIFEKHFFHSDSVNLSNDLFVNEVLHRYIQYLTAKAKAPTYYLSTIQADIYAEINEMLHKKIYGHSCISDYFKSKESFR
ncbi:MAG: hypothetical protein HOO06_03900 [Bdellovibrionaceae bacterium]|nr:hypothetical protein [Pseudobdellovibrionaceae bacterium]